MLLYVIMAGNLPFDEPNLPALFRKIARADYLVPTWFSPDMVSLFAAMLNPDPAKRYQCLCEGLRVEAPCKAYNRSS